MRNKKITPLYERLSRDYLKVGYYTEIYLMIFTRMIQAKKSVQSREPKDKRRKCNKR